MSEIRRYRKKPVVIEAMQTGVDDARLRDWSHGTVIFYPEGDDGPYAVVRTLEGLMYVAPGDWIIRGVQGEFYSCNPDIFAATYEEAGDD